MVKGFMDKMADMSPEDCQKMKQDCMNMKEQFKGYDWSKIKEKFAGGCNPCGGNNQWSGNQWCKPAWKEARAVIKKVPEGVIELMPGQTHIAEIEVFNDTHWPWKGGCTLSLADE